MNKTNSFAAIIILCTSLLLLNSCVAILEAKLSGYTKDASQIIENTNPDKTDISIRYLVVNDSDFPSKTEVINRKTKWFWVYALYDYEVFMGECNIYKSLPFAYQDMLQIASKNTSPFQVVNDSATYDVIVRIVDCETSCNYVTEQIFNTLHFSVSSAISKIKTEVEVFQSDSLIYKNEFSNVCSAPFIKKSSYRRVNIEKLMITNMSESLSLSIKDNIKKVINDLNTEL